jgi:hypothetical protein
VGFFACNPITTIWSLSGEGKERHVYMKFPKEAFLKGWNSADL